MRRVLLTGASGFIGSHAVEPLRRRGFDVHVVSSSEAPPGEHASEGVSRHRVNLFDRDATWELHELVRPTHLLHFAWYAKHVDFWTSAENVRWVEASLSLLRAFGEHGGQRAVMAGSCAEYDWASGGRCVETSTPLGPRTLYGVSKDAVRRVAETWCAERDVEFAWGRVFFVFGEREQPQRLVPAVARAVLEGRPALCSHGRQLRDFMYAGDTADAFVGLLDSSVQGAVNIGSGQPVSVAELVRLVATSAGRPELVRLGELAAREDEPLNLTADVTRLRDQVGWSPRLTLTQGVERAVGWHRGSLEAPADGRGGGGA